MVFATRGIDTTTNVNDKISMMFTVLGNLHCRNRIQLVICLTLYSTLISCESEKNGASEQGIPTDTGMANSGDSSGTTIYPPTSMQDSSVLNDDAGTTSEDRFDSAIDSPMDGSGPNDGGGPSTTGRESGAEAQVDGTSPIADSEIGDGPSSTADSGIAQTEWQTIHNDFYWYDEGGNPIRTRSGDLFKYGDTYYWYGGTNAFREQTCYTSTDLVHWEFQGIVLSHAVEANRIDIEYNESTNQFVMLLKYDGNGAHLGTAVSSAPDGDFTFLGQTLVDDALMGDMSAYKDTDGTLYIAYVSWATGTNAQHGIYRMSQDYLQLDSRIHLWNLGGREAPLIFKRNGIYYYMTSRTDWTASSETQYYSATNLSGPWSELTMLSTPGSTNSWDSQCDFVFPIEGTEGTVYLYGGDRWEKPDPRREGDYVWLPMTFDGDEPVLNYYQDWEINLEAGTWRPFDYQRNLALNKPATASSESGGYVASNVTDSTTYLDYLDSRWQSAASDPQWIMVDLESERAINRVILKWHENYGRSFQIQVSNDASTWTDVYTTTRGARRSVTDVTFATTTARYVRMVGTRRGTSNGYSLFDFMVLND